MLKKATMNWTVKNYMKSIEKATVCFDNSIQRGFVWDNKRKSLLIHSILTGYPIPPFYATKNTETKQYDMLDGKQRSGAIISYLKDEFALVDIPMVIDDEGNEIDLTGFKFSELDDEFKDEIEGYSLLVYYFEDISDEEINEMFFRLNNGRALSSIEINRAKAKSFDKIRELGQHEFLKMICTNGDFNKYKNEDVVIKSYIMLTHDNPCLDSKVIRSIISEKEISQEDEDKIIKVFDRLQAVYPIVKTIDTDAARKLKSLTHIVSIMPITLVSMEDEISNENFAEFLAYFFNGEPSINIDYNVNCKSGSNHLATIGRRLDAISIEYNKFDFNK